MEPLNTEGDDTMTTYKHGDLMRALFNLFDRYTVDAVTFEQAVKVAKAAKPNTTFNRKQLAFYKWHYKNVRDL